jgi:hypothetical protein
MCSATCERSRETLKRFVSNREWVNRAPYLGACQEGWARLSGRLGKSCRKNDRRIWGHYGSYILLARRLLSNFAGGISANADPETRYVLYYTSDVDGFEILAFGGGTSFVAPQLAGVTALLNEYVHSRVGLLNFPLYGLALTGQAYKNPGAPLQAITDGDNWFYSGRNGYSPAAGLGILDVANFARVIKALF